MITTKIDNLINQFNRFPESFEHNVWNCYLKCKEKIPSVEWQEYNEYIDYIVKKLVL